MADEYTVTKLYSIVGGKLERKNPACPKCGPGTFLAVHKNRKTCGKCGYSEMNAQEAKKVEKPAPVVEEVSKEAPAKADK